VIQAVPVFATALVGLAILLPNVSEFVVQERELLSAVEKRSVFPLFGHADRVRIVTLDHLVE
jgi:hypothetical protein